jgi:4'-phosphopantetheinyl transferase
MSLSLTVLPAPACAPGLMLRLHHPLDDGHVPSVPAMLQVLSEEERLRADRMADGTDRAAFVLGRYLLRAFVGELLDVDPRRLATRYTCTSCVSRGLVAPDHGRPGYILDRDRVPFQLSLSRTQGVILLAALDDEAGSRIGVDVEAVHAVGFDGFDAVALAPREREAVTRLPEGDRPLRRARLWARKEALVKALGTGFTHQGPDALDVLEDRRIADTDLSALLGLKEAGNGSQETNPAVHLVSAVAVVPVDDQGDLSSTDPGSRKGT